MKDFTLHIQYCPTLWNDSTDERHIVGLLNMPVDLRVVWVAYLRMYRPNCLVAYFAIQEFQRKQRVFFERA